MLGYVPLNEYCGIKVVESDQCLQTWQLNDFTKELMGPEWVNQFNVWAEYALPKQPVCYMYDKHTMITHPSVAKAIREQHMERENNKIDFRLSGRYGYPVRTVQSHAMNNVLA